jgi:hypothetical protein
LAGAEYVQDDDIAGMFWGGIIDHDFVDNAMVLANQLMGAWMIATAAHTRKCLKALYGGQNGADMPRSYRA